MEKLRIVTLSCYFSAAVLVSIGAVASCRSGSGGAPPVSSAQVVKGAGEFCKARAAYKVLALAAGGKLDPAPGSPREKIEAKEDEFCVSFAAATADAGPTQ